MAEVNPAAELSLSSEVPVVDASSGIAVGEKESISDRKEAVDADTKKKKEERPKIEEKPDTQLQKIETGDSLKVKQVLDTACLDCFRDNNFNVNYKSENKKIVIMILACGFALYGQFNRVPFPDNRFILCMCCVIYFSLNTLLTVVTYLDGDTILLTYENTAEKLPPLQIDGTFQRFQDRYVLTIREYTDNKLKGDGDSEKTVGVSGKMYVGKYFKSTGEFLESVFFNDVRDLIDLFKVKFSQGKFEELEYNHKEHQD